MKVARSIALVTGRQALTIQELAVDVLMRTLDQAGA